MNDPNGLICHRGVFHLYYQHNPFGIQFGNISWGHATSRDLKTWTHQPVALQAYDQTMIYSGCVIFDQNNLLQQPNTSLAAIYTEHVGDEKDYRERICLATSADGGMTFDQQHRQVILEHTDPDFRDPKVFFHGKTDRWIMVVARPKQYTICLYSSEDLIHWTHESDFTAEAPHTQYWECPDLYPLTDDNGITHWVLSMSGSNYDQQTWGMFYFIGTFDGHHFRTKGTYQWLDHGRDFYAGITFEGYVKDRIMMAWCNNWLTANQPHGGNWSGIMSSPRILRLYKGQVVHEFVTEINPKTWHLSDPQEVMIQLTQITLVVSRHMIQLLQPDNGWMDERRFPFEIKTLQCYEDTGLLELLINEGVSATWQLL